MEQHNLNAQGNPQQQIVTAAEFQSKYSSKPEVFRFLAQEVGAYLPPYDNITVPHLRELASGTRQIVMAADVKVINIPHFDGLTIEKMVAHVKGVQ